MNKHIQYNSAGESIDDNVSQIVWKTLVRNLVLSKNIEKLLKIPKANASCSVSGKS